MRKVSFVVVIGAVLVAVATAGDTLWQRVYQNGVNCQVGQVRARGTGIYVAGTVYTSSTTSDALLLKYSGSGALEMEQLYDGVQIDLGLSVGTGADNCPVLGVTSGSGTATASIVKYPEGGGDPLWVRTTTRAALSRIAVNDNNDVFVLGTRGSPMPWDSVWVAKYDGQGNRVWSKGLRLAEMHTPVAIALQGGDRPIVAVTLVGSTGQNAALIQYDANGDTAWTKVYPNVFATSFSALHVDRSSNLWAIGEHDYGRSLMRLAPWGELAWAILLDIYIAPARDIAADSLRAALLAYKDNSDDFMLSKYTESGLLSGTQRGGTSFSETPASVTVGDDNCPAVSGVTVNETGPAILTVKYVAYPGIQDAGPAPMVPSPGLVSQIVTGSELVWRVSFPGDYAFEVLDPAGRVVARTGPVTLKAGRFSQVVPGLPGGAYLCRVRWPLGTSRARFVRTE